MKKVLLRAPLLTQSGYGVHSRQIFKWLANQRNVDLYVQLLPWGITPWYINPEMENNLVGHIMSKSKPLETLPEISVQCQLPNEWDTSLAKFNIGISAVVETDRCNPEWIQHCNKMNLIIVPSNHCKEVLLNTGRVIPPIYVVPESYYEAIDYIKPTKEEKFKFNTDFNFLILGQLTGSNPWNDRKNTLLMLKWMCELFKDDPRVGIIIKTNSGTNTKLDREITKRTVAQVINEVKTGPYPRIHLIHGHLSSTEVAQLYKQPSVKALVSATRGEGFGLPLLEAAASGLPVIATNWSGHKDFLNLGRWTKLEFDLQEIHESRVDNRIFFPGMKWAEVKESDFKNKLTNFRKSTNMPEKRALQLMSKIKTNFSQKAIEKLYNKYLGEYL